MSSSRSNKAAALAKFRQAKRKRELGEDTTEDLLQIREEEDVYDVVDESEYQSLVESRRQREDFVVDDGTLKWSFHILDALLCRHRIKRISTV